MNRRIRPAAELFAGILTTSLFLLPAAALQPQPDPGAWEEVMETDHCDEEGHYEYQKMGEKEVTDKEAWDEKILHCFHECSVCGFRSYEGPAAVSDHILEEHPTGGGEHYYDPDGTEIYPSCREEYEIETIRHEAETHMEDVYNEVWVADREAYEEEHLVH